MSTEAAVERGPALPQEEWGGYFDGINRRIEDGADVWTTLEIVTDPIVGTEAEHLPLDSITHEDGDDQIAVGLGGRGERYPAVLWHYVDEPRQVFVTGNGDIPQAIIIESQDEALTLMQLHEHKS